MLFSQTTATNKIMEMSKKIRVVAGGTSGSKTISILLYLIALSQTDKDAKLTSVISESTPHLKRGAMRDFKNIMKGHNYWNDKLWNATDSIYTFETGSQIEFFSADQSDKLRGGRRDRCFMNEANNMTLDAFDQLEVRTKDFIFVDYNPTNEFWIYTEVMGKRDDVEFITLTYKDNEALSQEIVDSIEARKNRKGWWKVYGLGQLGEVEGKIYKDWTIIDEIPPEARLERYGLDFGYTNDPSSLVAIYKHNDGFILDEIFYEKGLSNKRIAEKIKELEEALVLADSAEPKSIDEIEEYGIAITGANKGPGSVAQGIQFVQEQNISVTKRSVNVIKEYRNYLWMTDKNGEFVSPNKPEHSFSHCLTGDTKVLLSNGKEKKIKNIKVGDIVKTKKGNNKVLVSQPNEKNAKIYEVTLSNGYRLRGTGNHNIYTNKGKTPIDALRYGDIIEVLDTKQILLWKKKLSILETNINGTVNTITELIGKRETGTGFIRQYGKIHTVKYKKDITYTTRMKIERTTKSLTLNLLKLKNTYLCIIRETGQNKDLEKKLEKIVILLDHLQKNGTHQKRELDGTANTEKIVGKTENDLIKFVKFVEKNIKHIFQREVNIAIRIVKLRRCGREDVYNLTINKEHNYYANKILVGNSMDAIRYAFNQYVEDNNLEVKLIYGG